MKFDVILEEERAPAPEGNSLVIAMCSSRDVKPQTSASLVNLSCNLVHCSASLNIKRIDVFGGISESLLSNARQKRLDFALNGPYTHMVCFDDDMRFPYDAVNRMFAADVDFICANAIQKLPNEINGVCLDFDGKRIDSTGKTGIEQIGWGSLACALIKLDKLRTIPKPHFEVVWVQELCGGLGAYQGEDHYFMKKIRENGLKLYCDHDLSQQVTHIGDFDYGFPQIIKE
jgi:hypothetical protein